ncbi:universal stress protein UspA [Anaerobacillus alkalidiazotrophicus]|uniref:Universal stress protein n=1 Tax=Anaerobacillus alkalidiazotrophicus TaxID=472963 RepID=A0A1S2M103_9BACI|nr:universal stress protein [Anaerobacillus alkalidiazotrophicus]OIJ18254.1 universal stress protein UspA [Anaerobacillus alkalidiazotrophicus]OIJ19733.1 universal stress protein UspA [Anaerobacillus alkalidiazotrophicus]
MEKSYSRILVAVDGSEEAKKALLKAIDVAKKEQAKIFIAHVVDTRTFATVEQYDRTVVSRAEEYAKDMLSAYKAEVVKAGIDVECILDFGSPKVKISKHISQRYNVDLIITGATGLNTVERLLIGSVSEYIARSAKCDVLIVRN